MTGIEEQINCLFQLKSPHSVRSFDKSELLHGKEAEKVFKYSNINMYCLNSFDIYILAFIKTISIYLVSTLHQTPGLISKVVFVYMWEKERALLLKLPLVK